MIQNPMIQWSIEVKSMSRTMIKTAGLALVLMVPMTLAAENYDQVRQRLESIVGAETPISIADSILPGILQVRLGSDIVYISDDGRYLMQGRLLDLDSRQDLTERAMREVRRELIGDLDRSTLISFGSEDLEHEIIVFTDVDCGFCRKLHEQIDEYNQSGIRVSYAAFPRAGKGSVTHQKMTSVWCAEDRHEAMNIAKAGETPKLAVCEAPVDSQYALGQSIGVTGTPALITAVGDLVPGYVPPEDLRTRLRQLQEAGQTGAGQTAD